MRVLYDICDMVERELEDIARNGELNPKTLEVIDESVDIVKDIETIKAMRGNSYAGGSGNGGYSNGYPMYYENDYSMARGNGGGRGGRSNRGGYSRHDEKEMLEDKIDDLKRQLEQINM